MLPVVSVDVFRHQGDPFLIRQPLAGGPAPLARPEFSGQRLLCGLEQTDILPMGRSGFAGWPAENTRGFDRVKKMTVIGGIIAYDGLPFNIRQCFSEKEASRIHAGTEHDPGLICFAMIVHLHNKYNPMKGDLRVMGTIRAR
ncbi:hypothetical protein GCM10010911_33760 [Paenibacillus nasutitermitis]|uniref:Uncharacterized protein n=1 Tax=Paenibacillus nasutitermitis TaxID=1652958 RepID=A0A916Z4E7_9BACL|nr:hypothetical protein GCM10010911_33760 [Paenibacillus nasutitermitis]